MSPVAVAVRVIWLLAGAGVTLGLSPARAQTPAVPLVLTPSTELREELAPEALELAPTFVRGARIEGQTDSLTTVEGQAELRRHNIVIQADQLQHDQPTDTARAQGNVRVNRQGNRFEGPELQLKLDTNEGFFQSPRYELLRNEAQGQADRVDFIDKDTMVATNATFTTCKRKPGPSWLPDWMISASSIEFDNAEDVGRATNGVLSFQGIPILATPYLTFPLSEKRKSGVLPPTLNLDNISGLELTLPYYLNLSPNRDATLYPTLMTRRGIDLAGEYRYLEANYNGRLRGGFMPSDRLRDRDRWAVSMQHDHVVEGTALGPVDLRLDVNRVSDNNYWRDFPRSSTSLTRRLLASDAVATWRMAGWAMSAGAYRWQTLQDLSAPITPPFDRLPSLAARRVINDLTLGGLGGLEASFYGEYTRFLTDRPQIGNTINGVRTLGIASVSRTWQAPAWYIRPRLQLHATHYQTDSPLANGANTATRILPTASLDAGMFFERETSMFGRSLLQTLEPRAFFVQTPYKDQSILPNYDASAFDFNLATIYTENPFGGNDRIADQSTLTLGATSRFIDASNGTELARVAVAQRIRFRDQQVTLPGRLPISERLSDLLIGARLNWTPRWGLEGNVQFNPKRRESARTTMSVRYSPGDYRVLNLAYRLQRGVSEQFDIGWQWPLDDIFGDDRSQKQLGGGLGEGKWYSVGRINYSVPDRKIVDLVAGFEYDGGCWIGRVVLESLQRGRNSTNRRVLFQLEFSGFSRIGSNPLQTLRDNVPRYQYLREEINPPSRFGRYD